MHHRKGERDQLIPPLGHIIEHKPLQHANIVFENRHMRKHVCGILRVNGRGINADQYDALNAQPLNRFGCNSGGLALPSLVGKALKRAEEHSVNAVQMRQITHFDRGASASCVDNKTFPKIGL